MRRVLALHLSVAALFLGAACAATWPLAGHPDGLVPGGKFLATPYLFHHLRGEGLLGWLSPTFPDLNFPDGGTAVLVGLPQLAGGALLAGVLSPTAAVNVSMILHLAFGGYAGWRLSRRVWGARVPSPVPHLVAGFAFGFSTYAVAAVTNGQIENVSLGYGALAAEALFAAAAGSIGAAVLAPIAVVAAFLSTPYLVMALLLAMAPLVFAVTWRRSLIGAVAGVVLVVAGMGVHFRATLPGAESRLFCPYELELEPTDTLAIGSPAEAFQTPPAGAAPLVLDPARLLSPAGARQEAPVSYLGWATVVLAAIGLAVAGSARKWLLLAALPCFVLALGPTLTFSGWPITWGDTLVRLPLFSLREAPLLGPLFSTIQAPVRLVVGVLAPLSLAAALALSRLPTWAALLLVGLPFLEQATIGPVAPRQPLDHVRRIRIYERLAQEPDRLGVIDSPPLGYGGGPPIRPPIEFVRDLLGSAWQHGHPIPYSPCNPPLYNPRLDGTRFEAIVRGLVTGTGDGKGLGEASLELSDMGFGWFVVHTWAGDAIERRMDGLTDPWQVDRSLIIDAATRELETVDISDDGYSVDGYLFRLRSRDSPPPAN